ncbi:hypothetical protein J6590_059360 [Homalodisca vitripennis]|nr:hypothetical protein J6590_059360 [Homalodisca vitripennis]
MRASIPQSTHMQTSHIHTHKLTGFDTLILTLSKHIGKQAAREYMDSPEPRPHHGRNHDRRVVTSYHPEPDGNICHLK